MTPHMESGTLSTGAVVGANRPAYWFSVLHKDVPTTNNTKGANMEANNRPFGTTSRTVLLMGGSDCVTSAAPIQCWVKARNNKRSSQIATSTKGLLSSRLLPIFSLPLLVLLCGCATKTAESFLPAVGEERPPNTARIYAHTGLFVPLYWVDWGDGAPRNAMIRAWRPKPSGYRVVARHYAIPPDSDLAEACTQALSGTTDERWELTKVPPTILRFSSLPGLLSGTAEVTDETGVHRMHYVQKQARSGQARTLCNAFAYNLEGLIPTATPGGFVSSSEETGIFVFSSEEALKQALSTTRGRTLGTPARDSLLISLKKPDGTTEWLSGSMDYYGQLNLILQDDLTDPEQGFLCCVPVIGEETPGMFTDACIIGRIGYGGTVVYDRPPGMVDLDALGSGDIGTSGLGSGDIGTSYMRVPVKFRVEAGKTYHITCKWGWKWEVREEHQTDR